jgi:hypothetical protein
MVSEIGGTCPKCGNSISGGMRCLGCHRLSKRGRSYLTMLIAIALILASLFSFVVLSTSKSQETSLSVNRPVGAGANDFWKTYPSTRADSGSMVTHPVWVQSALARGPVLIFVHLEDCMACAVQAPICSAVNESFKGQITYYDLLGGRDTTSLYEALGSYDPTGGSQLVPLTVVVNQVIDSKGSTVILWHSWEGIISEPSLDSWMSDSLSHYQNTP